MDNEGVAPSRFVNEPFFEDYISMYPSLKDPYLSSKLSAKPEFVEDKGNFRQQTNIPRLLTFIPRHLIMFAAGTGKTGVGARVVEELARALALSVYQCLDAGRIDRAFILTPNKALVDEFEYQIACVITSGQYYNGVLDTDTEEQKRKKISKNIRSKYQIMTLTKFLKKYDPEFAAKRVKQQEMILAQEATTTKTRKRAGDLNELKNAFIFMDEGDSIISQSTVRLYREGDEVRDAGAKRSDLEDWELGDEEDFEQDFKKKTEKYRTMISILKNVPTIKLCVSTATPAINSTYEWILMRDLLVAGLEDYYGMVTREDEARWTRSPDRGGITYEEFATYMNSLVSVLVDKGDPEDVNVQYMTNPNIELTEDEELALDRIPFNLYPIPMQGYQETAFKTDIKDVSRKRITANFTYPPGRNKDNTFVSYQGDVDYYQFRDDDDNEAKYAIIGNDDFDGLADCSIKNYEIVRLLMEEIGYDTMSGAIQIIKPGVIFIADEYVERGTIPLGAILLEMGFEPFMYNNLDQIYESGQPDYCGGKNASKKIIIPKRPRFAIITGSSNKKSNEEIQREKGSASTGKRRVQTILNILKSPDNADGGYIKIFIGSKAVNLGVGIYSVTKIIAKGGMWNYSKIYQYIYRALRAGGHIALREYLLQAAQIRPELQDMLVDEGGLRKVQVSIYMLVAFVDTITNSPDYKMYLRASEKQEDIKLKADWLVTIDPLCSVMADRNRIDKEECWNYDDLPTDYSTWNDFYLPREFKTVKQYIIENISKQVISISSLSKRFGEQLAIRALSYIISENTRIEGKQLQEANGILFLGREQNFDQIFYNNIDICTTNFSLISPYVRLGRIDIPEILRDIMKVEGRWSTYLFFKEKARFIYYKSELLEHCIAQVVKRKGVEYVGKKQFDLKVPEERVLNFYQYCIFAINKGAFLSSIKFINHYVTTGRGAKIKAGRVINWDNFARFNFNRLESTNKTAIPILGMEVINKARQEMKMYSSGYNVNTGKFARDSGWDLDKMAPAILEQPNSIVSMLNSYGMLRNIADTPKLLLEDVRIYENNIWRDTAYNERIISDIVWSHSYNGKMRNVLPIVGSGKSSKCLALMWDGNTYTYSLSTGTITLVTCENPSKKSLAPSYFTTCEDDDIKERAETIYNKETGNKDIMFVDLI